MSPLYSRQRHVGVFFTQMLETLMDLQTQR